MTPLKDRLATLPLVLAGPILRKVTSKSVTVWVALQESALITLSIKGDTSDEVGTGARRTVAVGANLHIAAVTAHPTREDFKPGIVYHYDLHFADVHKPTDLAGATNSAKLSYGTTTTLPGFALPPADISSVRLFHGSCRMPHGKGPDALALLDVLIEQAAANATARPHQLLLTGDQIYADDVAAALLPLLTDAGDTLLYGGSPASEDLPGVGQAYAIPPYWRHHWLASAGFTSDDLRSHLMSLAEYLAMYLFTWSDVLWPVNGGLADLPITETIKRLTDHLDDASDDIKDQWNKQPAQEIFDDAGHVQMHYATLFRVRRALANVATAMMFDDHEITDDWNMTLGFCRDVYSNQLARRVIQNGLVAYALCQHWGNVPEDFETGATTPPGAALLALLDRKSVTDYVNKSTQIQKITGVRTKPDWRDADPASLTYNYTLEADAYQVIVTDTRTWRAFPDGDNTVAHFLPTTPSNQLKAQITNTNMPALKNRVLLVVVTTNAPPTEPIRTAERNPWKTKHLGDSDHPDIYDGWSLPSVAFDRLLVALSDKLPLVGNTRKGWVILLSGDVHHGFSAHLKYRATKRFEDTQAQPASVVFVELVASAFKKQTDNTIILHKEGYTGAPWGGHQYVPPHTPEGYVGYNLPAGTAVAQHFEFVSAGPAAGGVWKDIKLGSGAPAGVPTVALGHDEKPDRLFDPKEVRLLKMPPEFRYRLDYLEADTQGQQPVTPPSIPPFPRNMSRTDAIKQFNQATNFYRDYNYKGFSKQQIVGLNNIGEITFEPPTAAIGIVNHTLRWKLDNSADFQWATCRVHMVPDDDIVYRDVKADNE
jgi:hypothetical protein